MQEPDRILALLGLAARAGAIVPGTERVRVAATAGKLAYAIVAVDASANAHDKLLPVLERRAVPHAVRYDRAELGAAVGKAGLSVVGVAERGFAKKLEEMIGRSAATTGERASAGRRPVRSRRQP